MSDSIHCYQFSPLNTVLCKIMPVLDRNLHLPQQLAQTSTICHPWSATRTLMRNPAGQHLARKSVVWHSRHMASPSQLALSQIRINCLQPGARQKISIRNMMPPCVQTSYSAHTTNTAEMESTKTSIRFHTTRLSVQEQHIQASSLSLKCLLQQIFCLSVHQKRLQQLLFAF